MDSRIVPPEWADWDDDMLVNMADMKYYYENYTNQVMTQAEDNKISIGDLDGRVSTLEHSIPVGPGGKGAYLDMGGTPDRYPTMTEMVEGDDGKETSFMVVARNDGIYFYNPKTKLLIPPKKGGGTLSIHGQFPQIFEREHAHRHEGRANISGIYTAKTADVGLDSMFLAYEVCTLLVVVNNEGEEYQTAFSPEGTASRIFRNGINTSVWSLHSGGDGGGGSVDPAVIQEINRRLGELEALPVGVDEFHNLSDVNIDLATDTEGLVYIDEFGKVRSDKVNPMLLHGGVPISIKSIGAKLNHAINSSVSGSAFANSPYIILDSTTTRVHTMCRFVAYDASNATVTQGREGRVTYIFNYGSVDQTLRLGTSQRFFTSNGFESGTRTVPAKMSHAYCPVILDNSGVMTECWAFMGAAPLEGIDLSGIEGAILNLNTKVDDHKTRLEALEAGGSVDLTPVLDRLKSVEDINDDQQLQIDTMGAGISAALDDVTDRLGIVEIISKNPAAKNDFHKVSLESTNNFQASMSAAADVIVHNLGVNSNPRVWLPEIVATGATPTASQVLVGRKMVIVNTGAQATKVSGAMMHFSDTISTNTYELPVGHSMEMYAHFYSSTFGWRVVRSGPVLPATGGGSGGSSTFVGLTDTPNSLTPNKIVTVNSAGNALEMSTASTSDLVGALKLAQGVVSGNSLLSSNCVGGEVGQSGMEFIPQADLTGSPLLLVAAWRAMTWVNLPTVAKFDTDPLPANTVREGRLTTVYNCSTLRDSKSFKLRIDPSNTNTRLLAPNYDVITEYEVPYGYGVRIMPVFAHTDPEANKRQWMVLEKFKREQS